MQTQLMNPATAHDGPTGTTMGRIFGFLFGMVAYLVFSGTILYAIGFVARPVGAAISVAATDTSPPRPR